MRKPSPLAVLFCCSAFSLCVPVGNAEELDVDVLVQQFRHEFLAMQEVHSDLQDKYDRVLLDLENAKRKLDQLQNSRRIDAIQTQSTSVDPPSRENKYPTPEYLHTVADIHRRNGSVLKGSVLENAGTDEKEFIDTFKNLKVMGPSFVEASKLRSVDLVQPDHSVLHRTDVLANSLLDASAQLEIEAHQLDRSRRFDEADRLRRLAKRLRKTARQRVD